jgi:hypothetical protein
MADNIQDPNEERQRQNPDAPDRTEGTTGREERIPGGADGVPGEERERDVMRRPDERRDEGEFGADSEADG